MKVWLQIFKLVVRANPIEGKWVRVASTVRPVEMIGLSRAG